jgi:hypothetical protein
MLVEYLGVHLEACSNILKKRDLIILSLISLHRVNCVLNMNRKMLLKDHFLNPYEAHMISYRFETCQYNYLSKPSTEFHAFNLESQ